jgi:hypothetical protein
MARQHLRQRLGQPALPHHALYDIPTQTSERVPAPVAVDQDQPLATLHQDERHLLANGLQGGDQPAHRLGTMHPGMGEGRVDAVPIDRLAAARGGFVHAPTRELARPQDDRVLSLQSPPPRLSRWRVH